MSFILNALQKSETERREKEQAPNLLTVQSQSDAEAEPKRVQGLWQLLSLLLLGGVLALGYTLLQQSQLQPTNLPRTSTPTAGSSTVNVSANPLTPPSSENLPSKLPSDNFKATEKALAQNSPAESPNLVLPTPIKEEKPKAEAINREHVTDLYRQPSEANNSNEIPKQNTPSLTQDQQALADRAQKLKAEMAEPLVPAIHNIPLNIQNRLPKMLYSAHIYSSDADAGFAIINDRRRYRGDQIAPGLVVVSIINKGVILTFEGYTFRLDAMKNWPLE